MPWAPKWSRLFKLSDYKSAYQVLSFKSPLPMCATYIFWPFRPSIGLSNNEVQAMQPHFLLYFLTIEYSSQYHYHVRGFEIRKNDKQLVATYLPLYLSIWYSIGQSRNRLIYICHWPKILLHRGAPAIPLKYSTLTAINIITCISQISSLCLYKSEHHNTTLQYWGPQKCY
jgi:hypothetical protein